jgi:cholest-4-en-3-one 26-monooxygenase
MDPSRIDLTDFAFWQADPHPTFDWLRANQPVFWHEAGPKPFWAVTRFDDISYINTQTGLFKSSSGVNLEGVPEEAAGAFEGNIVLLDDPEHRWLRAIVSKGFTPNSVRAMEPHIRELASDIVDRAIALGRCDFVDDVAVPLPITVIGELIGMPDRDLAKRWSDAIEKIGGSDLEARKEAIELTMYVGGVLAELAEERRIEPRDDLLSALVHAEVDGRKLTPAEHLGFMLLLNFAGNETTRSALAGGVLALLDHPEQMERIRRDPSLIPSAVEEILRFVTPVTYFARTATQNVLLSGKEIRAGETIAMWFTSGNRDEAMFPDPHRLDVGRMPNRQLAFGAGGAHFCLGAALARLELRVMLELLLQRVSSIELTGDVVRAESNFVRGVVSMPVELTAA